MGAQKETQFVITKHWGWSPEVWAFTAKTFGLGIAIGLVAFVYLFGTGGKPSPSPTVTVTEPGPTHFVYRTVKP